MGQDIALNISGLRSSLSHWESCKVDVVKKTNLKSRFRMVKKLAIKFIFDLILELNPHSLYTADYFYVK
jgi:hypothetical protein